jgi:hypothetical protein
LENRIILSSNFGAGVMKKIALFLGLGSLLASPAILLAQTAEEKVALEAIDNAFPGKLVNNPFNVMLNAVGGSNSKRKTVAADGIPGGQAIQLQVKTVTADIWGVALETRIGTNIQKGDVILLAFWARAKVPANATKKGEFMARIGRDIEPYDQVFTQAIQVSCDWRLYYVKGVAPADFANDQLKLAFQAGKHTQTLEFGQFYVTNSGQGVDLNSLPSGSVGLDGQSSASVISCS